jgi:hypothetical protein
MMLSPPLVCQGIFQSPAPASIAAMMCSVIRW